MIRGVVIVFSMNLLSVASAVGGWENEKPVSLKPEALKTVSIGPEIGGDYVSAEVGFAPFEAARVELEGRLNLKLKNRGEAHVTLISPPEFKILLKVLTPKEIRDAVEAKLASAKSDAKPVCVGEGIHADDRTWFVVIDMPSALRARHAVEAVFEKKGGQVHAFKADEFYPHVTLGFTKHDLHLQDGVVKDLTSCKYPIRR